MSASSWRTRRVGDHFLAGEFFPPGHPTRPPERAFASLKWLCQAWLDPVRREFGRTTIHSGFRTVEHNLRVGGAPRSHHVYELRDWRTAAADFSCAESFAPDWARFLERRRVGGIGTYATHVHADSRPGFITWSG